MAREQRYWRLDPDAGPGEPVAEHDGGVGLGDPTLRDYVSGPGNYAVVLRRPGKPIEGDTSRRPDHWPIELHDLRGGGVIRFNRGMARWFGLRLIEAAALDEAAQESADTGATVIRVAPAPDQEASE